MFFYIEDILGCGFVVFSFVFMLLFFNFFFISFVFFYWILVYEFMLIYLVFLYYLVVVLVVVYGFGGFGGFFYFFLWMVNDYMYVLFCYDFLGKVVGVMVGLSWGGGEEGVIW